MKISILTPSFNSAEFIERAIKSTLSQDYDNWEHIIVDGGSKDGTTDILKKYSHIKWISEKDNGQADAMNKAFNLSTGDIIVYLNADDELESNIFSFVLNVFKTNPICDAVFGNVMCKNAAYTYYPKVSLLLDDIVNINKEFCFPWNPVSYYYLRDVQDKIGPFPTDEHMAMDYWFLLRLYKDFTIVYHDKLFGTFHSDERNKSSDYVRSRVGSNKVLRDFIYEFNFHQYDKYLDEFLFTKLKQTRDCDELYNSLKNNQDSLKYLLGRAQYLIRKKLKLAK